MSKMLARRFQDAGTFATRSSSRLLLAVYLLCWLPSMLEAFTGNLPNVTITNASQEILVVENSNNSLQFTCTGESASNLTWIRGGNSSLQLSSDEPGISLSNNDSLTLILTINVSEADSNTLVIEDGVPYYCLATNDLGTARSHAVTLRYPNFSGFNESMQNTTVNVRLGQAVGLRCGYVGTPVPDPDVTWLKDGEAITIDPDPNPHYRLLENGDLVIYELAMSDIWNDSNNMPVLYNCRVNNVRIVESVPAPFFYTLFTNESGYLQEDPTVYIAPPTSVFLMKNEKLVVYNILATNNDELLLSAGLLNSEAGGVDEDVRNLQVSLNDGITQSTVLRTFPASLNSEGEQIAYPISRTNLTLIEELEIIGTTPMDEVFKAFTNEKTFNFTCLASGTLLTLVWYENGEQIPVDGETLTIPNASPTNNGVYQCFWTSEVRPSEIFASVSWAVVIRDRVPPSDIDITSTEMPDNKGRIVATEGTTVTLNVTVRSDVMPKVSWIFKERLSNLNESLDTSNMTLYRTSNITNLEEERYHFSLTLVSMTVENSGFYTPVVNDGFTGPVEGPTQFVSVEFPAEVVSVVSSHTCLLVGEEVSITCIVDGLPEPTVSFLKNSQSFESEECQSCSISNNELTFFVVTREDEGSYGCTAENMNEGDTAEDTGSLNGGRVFNYCDHPEVSVVGSSTVTASEGDEVTLTCQVTSIPPPVVTWMFDGRNINISDSYITTQTPTGEHSLTISSATTTDSGTYTCQVNNTAIPEVVTGEFDLAVTSGDLLPVYGYVVIGVGSVLFVAVLISLIVLCCCCYYSRKTGTYSASGKSMLAKDDFDGRGNVDRDSDEEDGKGEEPEAFQPQYESLPALRPAAPPQYKPSPAYGAQTEVEMVKMPIPDTESTAFEFTPGPPPFQGYIGRPGNGEIMEDGHGDSAVGLQARFEDFMSDDGQFV